VKKTHIYASEKKNAIIFAHMPKTGGTTLSSIISEHFSYQRKFSIHNHIAWEHMKDEADIYGFPEHTVYVEGHGCHGTGELFEHDRDIYNLTFLREPLATAVSSFVFQKKMGYITDSIEEFADSFKPDPFTEFLAGGGLEAAKKMLDEYFIYFGLTERFEESVALLSHIFKTKIEYTEAKNVSGSADYALDKNIKEILLCKLSKDIELYRYACEMFDSRISSFADSRNNRRKTEKSSADVSLEMIEGKETDSLIEKYKDCDPSDFNTHFALYKALDTRGEKDKSEYHFEKSCMISPIKSGLIIEHYQKKGNREKLKSICENILKTCRKINSENPYSYISQLHSEASRILSKLKGITASETADRLHNQIKDSIYREFNSLYVNLHRDILHPELDETKLKILRIYRDNLEMLSTNPAETFHYASMLKNEEFYDDFLELGRAFLKLYPDINDKSGWIATDMTDIAFITGNKNILSEVCGFLDSLKTESSILKQNLDTLRKTSRGASEPCGKTLVIRMGQICTMQALCSHLAEKSISFDILIQSDTEKLYSPELFGAEAVRYLEPGVFRFSEMNKELLNELTDKAYETVIILASLKYLPGIKESLVLAGRLSQKNVIVVPADIPALVQSGKPEMLNYTDSSPDV